jgi:uncharacterized integral membrane protein
MPRAKSCTPARDSASCTTSLPRVREVRREARTPASSPLIGPTLRSAQSFYLHQEIDMRIRTLLVVIALLLVAAFMALNWGAFATPASLNLLATTIEAPPALIMAAVLALVVLAGAVYMALWQSRILLESRRHAKELQAQRELADQAEASRLTELRATMVEQSERLTQRLTSVQEALQSEIRDQANSLAAMLGELGDRSARA